MSMDYLNLFPYNNVSKNRKEGKDRRHSCLAINNKEGHIVDFEPIREIPDPSPALVRMCDDHDFVASIYELG